MSASDPEHEEVRAGGYGLYEAGHVDGYNLAIEELTEKHQPNFDNASCGCGVRFTEQFSFERRRAWRTHIRTLLKKETR